MGRVFLFLLSCAVVYGSICTPQDCGTRCVKTHAASQWGADFILLESDEVVQGDLSFYYVDSGWLGQDILSPNAYSEDSVAHICVNDALWKNVYMGQNLQTFDGNARAEQPTDYSTNPSYRFCEDVSPPIPLKNFKDNRMIVGTTRRDNHGSSVVGIIAGRPNTWADGFSGYLTTFAPHVKPKIIFYGYDRTSNDFNLVEIKYFAFIAQQIANDADKDTIIVGTSEGTVAEELLPGYDVAVASRANDIFYAGGLVIAPMSNIRKETNEVPAPASAINAIAVGAVDVNVNPETTSVHQSIGPTTFNVLKPDLQSKNGLCQIDEATIDNGVGCSFSAPSVTALAVVMHGLLKSYSFFLVNQIHSIDDKFNFNGVIAAWLINSGKISPRYYGVAPDPAEEGYDSILTGTGSWSLPGKQFDVQSGKFVMYSMVYADSALVDVPLFSFPRSFFAGGAKEIKIKFTVYFRVLKNINLDNDFVNPRVNLRYLRHSKTGDDAPQNGFTTDNLITIAPDYYEGSTNTQGKKPHVTVVYSGSFEDAGTLFLEIRSQKMDRLYVVSYLDIATTANQVFLPGVPWDDSCFNPNDKKSLYDRTSLINKKAQEPDRALVGILQGLNPPRKPNPTQK